VICPRPDQLAAEVYLRQSPSVTAAKHDERNPNDQIKNMLQI